MRRVRKDVQRVHWHSSECSSIAKNCFSSFTLVLLSGVKVSSTLAESGGDAAQVEESSQKAQGLLCINCLYQQPALLFCCRRGEGGKVLLNGTIEQGAEVVMSSHVLFGDTVSKSDDYTLQHHLPSPPANRLGAKVSVKGSRGS